MSLKVNLLLCDEICIPFEQSFSRIIPPSTNNTQNNFLKYLPILDKKVTLQDITIIENEEPVLSTIFFLPNEYNVNDIEDIFIHTKVISRSPSTLFLRADAFNARGKLMAQASTNLFIVK